ncbi:MAG: nucleotide exchange factor GrpE [Myxococcales bacterium]|nr:nucleotide exchange factor GrpE [Myxococcales bacterium]
MSTQDQQAHDAANPSPEAQASASEGAAKAPDATEVARLTSERNELNDRLLRLAAEFENYKRRIRKEMDDASVRATESVLKEMLPVMDNLDRALQAARGGDGGAPSGALVEGVQLVQKQFFVALEKCQVKPFDAEGQPFDPQVHEAVSQLETDKVPAGAVASVFQRGYRIGQRLLRPALVAVAKAPSQSAN